MKNMEKNINEISNSEKKRMEIKFSCGEDGISEYLDDGWNILKEEMRDCFGSHTYERVDKAGSFHTEWID